MPRINVTKEMLQRVIPNLDEIVISDPKEELRKAWEESIMEKTELMYNEKYYQGAYRLDNTTNALYCILETANEGETALIHRILPNTSGKDPTPFIIADGIEISGNNISWGSASYYKTLYEATDTSDDRDVDIEKSMDMLMTPYFNDKFLYIVDMGDETKDVSQNAIVERYVEGYGWISNKEYSIVKHSLQTHKEPVEGSEEYWYYSNTDDQIHIDNYGWVDYKQYEDIKNSFHETDINEFENKITKVNAVYVDLDGRKGQIDISMDLYNALYKRQCSPELALAFSRAIEKSLERENISAKKEEFKPSPEAFKKIMDLFDSLDKEESENVTKSKGKGMSR